MGKETDEGRRWIPERVGSRADEEHRRPSRFLAREEEVKLSSRHGVELVIVRFLSFSVNCSIHNRDVPLHSMHAWFSLLGSQTSLHTPHHFTSHSSIVDGLLKAHF